MSEGFDSTDTGETYDSGDPQVTPELAAQVQAQMAAQGQMAAGQPGLDPIQQAHADYMVAAEPALADPDSPETRAFVQLVNETAEAVGVPELAGDLRFARRVLDTAEPDALMTPSDAFAFRVLGASASQRVLPF